MVLIDVGVRRASTAILSVVVATALAAGVPAHAASAPDPTALSEKAVVVLMKDQLPTLPAGRAHGGQRSAAARAGQDAVLGRIRGLRPHKVQQFALGNAFAATVTADQAAALQSDPAVAAVVPDIKVPLTAAPAQTVTAQPAANGLCPTDPAHPLLEPEGLELTHAASGTGAPSAADLVDGSGVTVGVVADGVDTNVPDFIRPNGKNVVSEVKSFDSTVGVLPGEETTGDVSTIGAQGAIHDLHDVNPALPQGCTVRIVGVAPGADIKVGEGIGFFASFSDLLLALDHAVNVDHVDVLNESFGVSSVPDVGAQDALRLFDDEAVAAGVTVVAGSGDAGPTNTIISPAADPNVISVGATTALRALGQVGNGDVTKGWANNNIGEFSSSGFSSSGATVDVVAPGLAAWAANATSPGGIYRFAGTSQSAPFVSGAAALVIQAYRKSHSGTSPSPALVKQLLLSTADDIGASPENQGAGLLNARSAVEAAMADNLPNKQKATGASHIVTSTSQINVEGHPGATVKKTVSISNVGGQSLTVAPSVRAFRVNATQTQTVTSDGVSDTTVNIPVRTCDQVEVDVSNRGIMNVPDPAKIALYDGHGVLQNLSLPQGSSGYARLLSNHCSAGSWQVVLPKYLTGSTTVRTITTVDTPVGQVAPALLTLGPGKTADVKVTIPVPADAGDTAYSVQLSASNGHITSIPVTARTVLTPGPTGGAFHGTLTGGNGRPGAGAQIFTYDIDVPAGLGALHVGVAITPPAAMPADGIGGYLLTPDGEIADTEDLPNGSTAGVPASLNLVTHGPAKGRWRLLITLNAGLPQNGVAQDFAGSVDATTPVTASSRLLPSSTGTVLPAGVPVTVPVTVVNTGGEPVDFLADPRTTKRQTYQLTLQEANRATSSTQDVGDTSLEFGVPSGTSSFTAVATSDISTFMTLQSPYAALTASNLHLAQQGSTLSSATISEKTPTLSAGMYPVDVESLDPVSTPARQTMKLTGSVVTQGFDRSMTVSSDNPFTMAQDPFVQYIDPTPGYFPLAATAAAGGTTTFNMVITPTGKPGTVVKGVLNIIRFNGSGVLAAIPYTYTVGASTTTATTR